MTNTEKRVFVRTLVAGTILGLAIGLIMALFIAVRPGLFAALMR